MKRQEFKLAVNWDRQIREAILPETAREAAMPIGTIQGGNLTDGNQTE